MNGLSKTLFQVVGVIAFSTAIALAVNAVREAGLPMIMPFPPEYKCPDLTKQSLPPIQIDRALHLIGQQDTVFVDARKTEEFEEGHITGAINVPYLLIEPIGKDVLIRLKHYKRIVVYCNTKDAEKSRSMAGELADAGLQGVTYLEGGYFGWAAAGGKYKGKKPEVHDEWR